ncbi:MAG TPA: alpha/beta hydrolase-fold protein [Phenylobacterium sp.]|nr:alpha/beta hydrolase-fold protein [Phenylobacterium sp.]
MRKSIVSAMAFGLALGASATSEAQALKVVSTGLAAKMATEQLVVHSANLDRDMIIEVTRPFAPLLAGRKAPAVYVLDGGYEFAVLEGWLLGGSGGMESAFIVCVGYRPADYAKRDADLMTGPFRRGDRVEAGRALAFRAFLIGELRPLVEARYAVDPSKAVLVGHSAGGSFAALLFADQPEAFSSYVIGSPAVKNEPDLLARLAAVKPGRERIFVAAGGNEGEEMTEDAAQVASALKSHPSLSVRSQVFPGATHLSYYPQLIAEGLAYVLPPKVP